MAKREINLKITPPPAPTDAELAARWAAEALAEGRYELGAALANIARNAARVEARSGSARMVPMLGQTRDEIPAPVSTVPAHLYDEIERSGAIPRPDAGVAHSDPDAMARHIEGARFRDDETAVVAMGPTGNGNRDVPELASEAQTELFGAIRETDLETPPHGRCVAVIETAGPSGERNTIECHEVIIWDHGHIGDASTPAIRARWRHLNPALDQHHYADPGQG